ncbi:MAG: hypothetical protein NC434_03175 [Ruminococcus sp.]|nr:hypothetical protein [Ruminococcus sp.]
MDNDTNFLNLLDLFEEQIDEKGKEVSQRVEKTNLYGEWVDFDLDFLIDERNEWKEKLVQRGVLIDEQKFYIRGKKIQYSGNYINRVLLNNCVENFIEMQCRYFNEYYYPEIAMFSGCIGYVGKIVRNFVNENIRFIKVVLIELGVVYNDDNIDQDYLKYTELDEIDAYLDNLGTMISQKITDSAQERFDKRLSSDQPEFWVGGEGIGGLIKGYVLGSALSFGAEKISEGFNKIGDSIAAGKLKKKLDEVFEEVREQVSDLLHLCADTVLPFLMIKLQESNMEYWFDIGEDNRWSQILEYTDYERKHNLIDDSIYWDRLVYLLNEYPFVGEIYIKIIDYDLDCMKELYMLAEFFGMGDTVLGEAALCMAKLIGRYKEKNMNELIEKEVNELWDKYQEGIYEMDECVVDDNEYTEEMLENYDKCKEILYKLLVVYKIYFLKKKIHGEIKKTEYTKEEIEALWKKVGCGCELYKINAAVEGELLKYYRELVAVSIERNQIVQFESNLEELIAYMHDENTYKSNFANCVYASLLMMLYKDIDAKKERTFLKDIQLAAEKGVILAKYLTAQFSEDEEEKEELLFDAIKNNFPAVTCIKEFYLERFKEKKSVWDEILADRWKAVEDMCTN